jgi:uncharacterized protein YukE
MPPTPTTPPGLEPLRFDHAAAAAAIEACTTAAAAVDAAVEARGRAATVARAEWRGPTRDDFDREMLGLDRDAASLSVALRHAAGAIGTAREAVGVENASRREARILWQRSQLAG